MESVVDSISTAGLSVTRGLELQPKPSSISASSTDCVQNFLDEVMFCLLTDLKLSEELKRLIQLKKNGNLYGNLTDNLPGLQLERLWLAFVVDRRK